MSLGNRIAALYAFLIGLNCAAWGLAFWLFASRPLLLGTALLAYTFGLRHAVDADHISAIDNVTRKLMQDGKRSTGVGFFFSFGHSTVVFALTAGIAIAAAVVKNHLPALEQVGQLVGTSVSAAFLFLVAAINAFVLLDIFRAFRSVRRGEGYDRRDVDDMLDQRGLIGRFFRPLINLVDASWKMYPIGLLFGLGFDTATEVGLLGIAAVEAGKGLPVYTILVFPLLFTAGMSLVDTTDGILMLGAYGWAFVKPLRKLYYNLVITLVSVLVALIVGGIEAATVVASQLHLSGGAWDGLRTLSDNFGTLGFVIIGVFLVSWLISIAIYKLRRYDELDEVTRTVPAMNP
ncbi:MAG TPA: HoxN/HupN/NixA family nickel/cobalt transporter [Candidatus Cybelea sp.]|jgi:high-affinity nickel-transport protein|nr:HoxN/HupN/NixA family nickel/cobalt transporter [Candidatus Cybelea sp.]